MATSQAPDDKQELLASIAPQAPQWLQSLSLFNSERRAAEALGRSRLLAPPFAFLKRFSTTMQAWVANSALAPYSAWLSIGALCLLFMASPFVGTGTNALLVLLALVMTLFRMLCAPDARARFSSLDLPVLAFIAVHFMATGFSPFLLASVKGLAKMLIYWAAYFSFRQTLADKRAPRWILAALLLAGTLEAAYGIYQWKIGVAPLALWEDPDTANPVTRVYSTLLNPNLLAGYLLPVFSLAITGAIVWRERWRLLALAALATTPLCIFFTYSRGAYLGLGATVAVFVLLAAALEWKTIKASPRLQGAIALAGLLLVALFAWRIMASAGLQERLASIFTLRGDSSNSFRMNVWTGVFRMVKDNWLLGVGIGNTAFRDMYGLYMVSGFEALGAYNIFFEVLAEMGVIGLIVWLWLLVASLSRNLLTFFTGLGENRWWAAAIFAALIGTCVMGLFDTVFYRPAIQLEFWLLLALTVAVSPQRDRHPS